jgi:hypothetical protein
MTRTSIPSRRVAADLAAAGALAVAGCGSDDDGNAENAAQSGPAPSAGQLFADSFRAAEGRRSASFRMDMTARGSATDPQLQQFLTEPLGLNLQGAAGRGAVDMTGRVSFRGRDNDVAVRADDRQSFVQVGGTWYGPGDGIDSAQERAGNDRAQTEEAIRVLRERGGDVISGQVRAAEIDGQPVWQIQGNLNADGIIRAAQEEGDPLDEDQQRGLRAIAPLVNVTYAANQRDRLPRRFRVRFRVTRAQIQALQAIQGEDAEDIPVNDLDVNMGLDMTEWDRQVSIEAPANPTPIDQLGGALAGAFLQGSGQGG